ncbi:MAG: GGDEF domain-containing protein [Woeseia sp.]
MSINAANLDDFPESPYAAELRKQSSRLRFDARLEREYLDEHLRRIQPRARIWTALAALLAGGFTIAQWLEENGWTVAVLAHVLLILPISLALAWLAWSRAHMRLYLRVATILAPILGASVAIAVAQAVSRGAAEEMGSLMLLLIATFFFVGLLFRAALIAGMAILIGFTTAAAFAEVSPALLLKCVLFLAIGTFLGVAICRDVERSYRKRFLEQSLINELVDRDGLTGLKNRRAFDEHLLRVWQQCLRGQTDIAFLLIDIDFFKAYNDRYGHQAGDAALRQVAHVLREFARRPLDIAARYGGEEFVIILYDLAPAAVRSIAEEIRQAVEKLQIEHLDSDCIQFITVSIGAAIVRPAIGRTPKGALQLADEALYQAKLAGRNRCIFEGQAGYEALVTGSYRNPEAAKRH